MIASFSQVFVESINRLVQHEENSDIAELSLFGKAFVCIDLLLLLELPFRSMLISLTSFRNRTMLATILIKAVIWWWCGSGDPGPGVGALVLRRVANSFPLLTPSFGVLVIRRLAQDAKNDVWFNTMSLLFPWVGEKFAIWWLDP